MKQTSRVIAVWKLLYTLLCDAMETAGEDPKLVLMGGSFDPPTEGLVIRGVPADKANFDRPTNNSKEETFILRVTVFCEREALTAEQSLDRLQELADIAQNALRDIETGKPVTYFQTALGSPWAYPEVVAWAPQLSAAPRGIVATGDLDIRFLVRI